MKQDDIQKLLSKFGNQLSHENQHLQSWIKEQKVKFNGLPCELLDIRYSQKQDE